MPKLNYHEVEPVEIAMPDGIKLSARLWMPNDAHINPVPVLFEYIPYRKRDISRLRDERNHAYFAASGYASIRVDMRGSGDSGGVMPDMYSPTELNDAIQVINWLAEQSWCDGSVGMFGTSWGGTASLQAAVRCPKHLKAIIAVCATNDRFDDDIHHMGGLQLTDSVEWGATLPAILACPPDPKVAGEGWRNTWIKRLDSLTFPLENWMYHELRDDYWRWGSVTETAGIIKCPILTIGGWSDRYSNCVLNLVEQNPKQCWGIVGPWGHHYPDVASPGPGIHFQSEAVRWWNYWLKGIDNGYDSVPRLRVWRCGYDEPIDLLEERTGAWTVEPRWPSKSVSPTIFYLGPNRLSKVATEAGTTAQLPGTSLIGTCSGDSGYFGRHGGLPLDQTPDDLQSIIFETEPLENPVEILGQAVLSLLLPADDTIGCIAARLNDVPPNGGVARVSYAIGNLALNHNQTTAQVSEGNQYRDFKLTFPNAAYRFEKGHRIRLAISTSYWPLIWPVKRTRDLVIFLAESRMTIPVRTAGHDIDPHHIFARSSDSLVISSEPVEVIESNVIQRNFELDNNTGRHVVQWRQPKQSIQFSHSDWRYTYETLGHHEIRFSEPSTALCRFTHTIEVARDTWEVAVTCSVTLSASDSVFNIDGSIEVLENNEILFKRCWNPSIQRNCS